MQWCSICGDSYIRNLLSHLVSVDFFVVPFHLILHSVIRRV